MRFDPGKITVKEQKYLFTQFWTAITLIESYDESQAFLRDLLHPQEVVMFARRIQIAKMLREGFRFEEIALILRTAPNTIAKINKAIDYGRGGLAQIADQLLEQEMQQSTKKQERLDPFSWTNIKRRYALYFWPLTMLDQLEKNWEELQKTRKKRASIPR